MSSKTAAKIKHLWHKRKSCQQRLLNIYISIIYNINNSVLAIKNIELTLRSK